MVESRKGDKIMLSIMLICGNDIFDDFGKHQQGEERNQQSFIECETLRIFNRSRFLYDLFDVRVTHDGILGG
jgi:hypothetical protein